MALHQKFSFGDKISIEFHAGAPGEQFIGVNPQSPSDAANPPAATAVNSKQTVVVTPYQKIVTPA